MTTEKQTKANQANSKKSTGAKTPEGKAVVSGNAMKHGLFSSRLILDGENVEEYHQLLDDIIQSLRPQGALEHVLAEKVCTVIWKQLRLTKAEKAAIELDRRIERGHVKDEVKKAMGLTWRDAELTNDDFEPMGEGFEDHLEWCGNVVLEYSNLSQKIVTDGDLDQLKQAAPNIYEQLQVDYPDLSKMALEMYEARTSLSEWVEGLNHYCTEIAAKHLRKPLVQSIAKQVQDTLSAPIGNELLQRYQLALDGELYKALEALRKQQEHRYKIGIVIEAEAA